jgi:hypothetical protein
VRNSLANHSREMLRGRIGQVNAGLGSG